MKEDAQSKQIALNERDQQELKHAFKLQMPFILGSPDSFGGICVRFDTSTKKDGELHFSLAKKIIGQQTFDKLLELRQKCVNDEKKDDYAQTPNEHLRLILICGTLIIHRLITLIFCTAILIRNFKAGDTSTHRLSRLLNPTQDGTWGLLLQSMHLTLRYRTDELASHRDRHIDVITELFADFLNLIRDHLAHRGQEITNLHRAYDRFVDADDIEAVSPVLNALGELSYAFAEFETEWEHKQQTPPAAQPAAKPKKQKRGRKGSGLKGTKTEIHAQQLQAFVNFIKTNPIEESDNSKTIGARAKAFWNKKKNFFEKHAKSQGEKRGYANYKSLADAYRKSPKIKAE